MQEEKKKKAWIWDPTSPTIFSTDQVNNQVNWFLQVHAAASVIYWQE